MLRVLVLIALFGAIAAPTLGHGGGPILQPPPPDPPPEPEPVPDPPPPMRGPPTGSTDPGLRPPPEDPKPPGEVPEDKKPDGPHETPSDEPGPVPIKPQAGDDSDGRERTRVRTRRGPLVDQGWRIWWEYNRTDIVGLRHLLHDKGTITGAKQAEGPPDPLGGYRPTVLDSLRTIGGGTGDRLVRAAALIALGRIGDDSDARLYLGLLADRRQPSDVHEAAAVGLALLPAIRDLPTRTAVRLMYDRALDRKLPLRTRAHEMLLMGMGIRARYDKALVMRVAARAFSGSKHTDEAAALALAGGFAGDRMLFPELKAAALKSRFGGKRLSDVGRSHAVHAFGLLDDPAAVDDLLRLTASRRAGPHTKRSAVIALGRLLHSGATDKRIGKTLVRIFTKNGDVLLRGFAMLAAGGAKAPVGVGELMTAIDRGGNAALKPYAALALGLAARGRDGKTARRIRTFLTEELEKTKEQELTSALCIAAGLSGARKAEKALLARVERKSLTVAVRGAAAQGLGLLGNISEPGQKAIVEAMKTGPRDLLGDAALALGLLGRRTTAPLLVEMLAKANSGLQRGRIMLALGHLGHARATEPLLRLLQNEKEKTIVREFAAVALGLMGDPRERDVLFELDAGFNYFATTTSSHELLRLY